MYQNSQNKGKCDGKHKQKWHLDNITEVVHGFLSVFIHVSDRHTNRQFTVVCLVAWPWIGNEAGGDLVSIQTSLLFICKLVSIRTA